jgi:hypothetical protein
MSDLPKIAMTSLTGWLFRCAPKPVRVEAMVGWIISFPLLVHLDGEKGRCKF